MLFAGRSGVHLYAMILCLLQEPPSGVVFPQEPAAIVQPAVPLAPAVMPIARDEVMVIVSEKPALVIASPDDMLSVVYQPAPVRLYAKKLGESQASWSLYDDPRFRHVYLVTVRAGAAIGPVELIAADSLDSSSVVRRRLMVSGDGVRPPPVPTPEPSPPQPTPPIPRPTDRELRVMLLLDESDPPSASTAVRAANVTAWLQANCCAVNGLAQFRVYDRSTIETDGELADEAPIWAKLFSEVADRLPAGPVAVIARGTTVDIRSFSDAVTLLQALKGER